jgi:hypothetical protein
MNGKKAILAGIVGATLLCTSTAFAHTKHHRHHHRTQHGHHVHYPPHGEHYGYTYGSVYPVHQIPIAAPTYQPNYSIFGFVWGMGGRLGPEGALNPVIHGYLYAAPTEADSTGYSPFWHYCRATNAYYPNVDRCQGGWEVVRPSTATE